MFLSTLEEVNFKPMEDELLIDTEVTVWHGFGILDQVKIS
jgi:hypothetical protein